ENPQQDLKDKRVIDSGCFRYMTRNRSYLIDYEEINEGFFAFGGNSKGRKITRKGKIRTDKLDFEDVYFVKELKFNLFSVSQMCDKKNSVLFTDTACVVLSPDFKLTDESHVLLKVLRKDDMYSVDLKNVVPQGGLTCLFAKATLDESILWRRRLRHVNFKTINKLVKGNIVRVSTPIETHKTLLKDEKGEDVYEHLYRSMIGSLMYLTSSMPDIMLAYALTVNPAVYTSCIEQFWTTTKAKNINREAQIHAKVDGKKVIIYEATIRRDLKFEDEGGIDCLSNEVIFEQLTLVGYENL
nr:ribonuclease H-like domain-containing protein [Tanacetum cinerariifolium]